MAEPIEIDDVLIADALEEHLYLSACIDAGRFDPVSDGLSKADFPASAQMFKWFAEYAASGPDMPTPPLDLVRRLHPSFQHVPGVDRRWARDRLHSATGLNRMVRLATGIVKRVEEGERFEDVWSWTRGALDEVPLSGADSGVDLLSLGERPARSTVPCVYRHMEKAGGIGVGNFVLIAGRPGEGKSWRLAQHAAAAAMGGRRVVYYSLEMNAHDVGERMALVMLGKRALSMSHRQRVEAMTAMIPAGGSIVIKDQTFGYCSPASVARDVGPGDVAVIDYVGLMTSGSEGSGASMAENAKSIANALRNLSQGKQAVVIAGAQLNRTAVGGAEYGVEALAQTDALGQDADLVVALRRSADGVTTNQVIKARHGESGGKWYTAFDPLGDGFAEMDKNEAWRLIGA